jgi:hypothetical protein
MADLDAALAHIRGAWMTGRSAREQCPPDWMDAVADADPDCALAALAGHASAVLFRPVPSALIEPRPLLPRLARPTVPDAVRPRLRRLLGAQKGAAQKAAASLERPVVDLVTARGFALHPADWLPAARDDWAPDLYAPWLDWVRGESMPVPAPPFGPETYEQYPWAMRRGALVTLRRADPAAARAIIAARLAAEPAERRLKLLELLEVNLAPDDGDLLESATADRSDRVPALARTFLARLGRAADAEADAAELAAMVEVETRGLLRRRRRLSAGAAKNAAQATRRRELFKTVSLAGLARALGLSELQLVEATPAGADDGIAEFVQMVAATGADAAVRALLQEMLEDDGFPLVQARPLAPRLTPAERRTALPGIIARDTDGFETTLAMMDRILGEVPLAMLLAAPGYAALEAQADAALSGDEARRPVAAKLLGAMVTRLALLLDAAAAAAMVARLTEWGISPADPLLDLMQCNAALNPETMP